MPAARRVRRVPTKPPKPVRKPMAMARRVSLFERAVSIRLAPIAVDLLHEVARVLHEGSLDGDAYAGSTMMTVDLGKTRHTISDPPDAATAQRVALLYASDERCRNHARRIALAEARRAAGCDLTTPHIDIESSARGAELLLSLNVEATRQIRQARKTP